MSEFAPKVIGNLRARRNSKSHELDVPKWFLKHISNIFLHHKDCVFTKSHEWK